METFGTTISSYEELEHSKDFKTPCNCTISSFLDESICNQNICESYKNQNLEFPHWNISAVKQQQCKHVTQNTIDKHALSI
jgi:hypothetical protein